MKIRVGVDQLIVYILKKGCMGVNNYSCQYCFYARIKHFGLLETLGLA